uniref:Uncharacterized protein n=1 Tax=Peronospora matthiolae TaxID=2874970 RepID=A0AAV1TLQ3_9STRA
MREKPPERVRTSLCGRRSKTAATDVSSVAAATQPVSLGDADDGHEVTHVFTEYELGVSYSPDTEDGSVSTAIESKPPAKRGMDDAMRRISLVRLMNQTNHRRSEGAREIASSGANSGVGSPIDTTSQRGVSPSVGTSQEEGPQRVASRFPRRRHGCL